MNSLDGSSGVVPPKPFSLPSPRFDVKALIEAGMKQLEAENLKHAEEMARCQQDREDRKEVWARVRALRAQQSTIADELAFLHQKSDERRVTHSQISASLDVLSSKFGVMEVMLSPCDFSLAFIGLVSDLIPSASSRVFPPSTSSPVVSPSTSCPPSSSPTSISMTSLRQRVFSSSSSSSSEEKERFEEVFEGWDEMTFSLCEELISRLQLSAVGQERFSSMDITSLTRFHLKEAGRNVLMTLNISPSDHEIQLNAIVSTLEKLFLSRR